MHLQVLRTIVFASGRVDAASALPKVATGAPCIRCGVCDCVAVYDRTLRWERAERD